MTLLLDGACKSLHWVNQTQAHHRYLRTCRQTRPTRGMSGPPGVTTTPNVRLHVSHSALPASPLSGLPPIASLAILDTVLVVSEPLSSADRDVDKPDAVPTTTDGPTATSEASSDHD